MAAIDGSAGPSMATKSAVDGPAGQAVAGDHLRRDRSLHPKSKIIGCTGNIVKLSLAK